MVVVVVVVVLLVWLSLVVPFCCYHGCWWRSCHCGVALLGLLHFFRAACLQNEIAPEKLLNRYEKRFEKREKRSEKRSEKKIRKSFSPSQTA